MSQFPSPYKTIDILATNKRFNVRDELQTISTEEVVNKYLSECNQFSVCCLHLTGDKNVGQIVRTSNLFGAKQVIAIGRKKVYTTSCVGAHKYIPLHREYSLTNNSPNTPEEITIDSEKFSPIMDKYNCVPIFVEQGGVPLHKVNWGSVPNNVCFVMGSESNGIPTEIIDSYKSETRNFPLVISIPQSGVMRSHNVASAASIVIWEYYKFLLDNPSDNSVTDRIEGFVLSISKLISVFNKILNVGYIFVLIAIFYMS